MPLQMEGKIKLVSHFNMYCHNTSIKWDVPVNSSHPGQNGHHFMDDIFNHIFFSKNARIFIQIPLKFVP